jgi:hypothetical protein
MYDKIAAQHDKIDDFRAKLLGFLPVVTGIGLFALVKEKPGSPELIAAIGFFGAIASIGLFVHELRGITECYMLITIGCALEQKLAKTAAPCGTFSSRAWWGFRSSYVSREMAALIVYPATIAAWTFVAVWGAWTYVAPTWSGWPSYVADVWRMEGFLLSLVAALAVFVGVGRKGECLLAEGGRRIDKYTASTGAEAACKVSETRQVHDFFGRLLRNLFKSGTDKNVCPKCHRSCRRKTTLSESARQEEWLRPIRPNTKKPLRNA